MQLQWCQPLFVTGPLSAKAAVALLRAMQTVLAQDVDGHVKPIPHDEDFAEASAVVTDADLALAIRLQEEEMSHVSMPAPLPSSAPPLRRCFSRGFSLYSPPSTFLRLPQHLLPVLLATCKAGLTMHISLPPCRQACAAC